jgi:hypothetical protein
LAQAFINVGSCYANHWPGVNPEYRASPILPRVLGKQGRKQRSEPQPADDIMVFGQAPCSAGRSKRRNVSYLGLLRARQSGLIEITALYTARFGQPASGQKIFIVTRQQKDGWEGFDQETSEIVPPSPGSRQASATLALPLQVLMHKGCTRDTQGAATLPTPDIPASSKPEPPARGDAVAVSGGPGAADRSQESCSGPWSPPLRSAPR